MAEKKSGKLLSAIAKATVEIVVAQSSIQNSYDPGQNNIVSVRNTEPMGPSREERAYGRLLRARAKSGEDQEEIKKGIEADKLRNDLPQNQSSPPSNDIKKGHGTHSKIQGQLESRIKSGQSESKSPSKGSGQSSGSKPSEKASSESKGQGSSSQTRQGSPSQSTGQISSPQNSQKAPSESKGQGSASQSSQGSSSPGSGQSSSPASSQKSSSQSTGQQR